MANRVDKPKNSKKRTGREFLEENPEIGERIEDFLSDDTGQNQLGGPSLKMKAKAKRLKGLPAE